MDYRFVIETQWPKSGKSYGDLNNTQNYVIDRLRDEFNTSSLVFTQKILKYLLDNVKEPQVIDELGQNHIENALEQILQTIKNDPITKERVGWKTFVRIIFDHCPRPWC